ncbi:hypothetical protein OL229_09290 [Neisseriaceae bacterium JH1-16]|nr:hypothetical protein [Neisseriaceae bacterium JH1-16]
MEFNKQLSTIVGGKVVQYQVHSPEATIPGPNATDYSVGISFWQENMHGQISLHWPMRPSDEAISRSVEYYVNNAEAIERCLGGPILLREGFPDRPDNT